ncbi:RES family NAD+ phosphorylase [Paraburkholderia azotifigens]|uniref:RES family NAD+ phosphorylase n=1 Tax=Paraburkholderia azotifigens TaxID=2057004 RepID=UPI0013156240|nr:RES family NAD+ phosphorylase [Paraburkholderia azotifigens]
MKQRFTPTSGDLGRDDRFFEPYTGTEISAPPVLVASEGRLNRHRESILYLATDEETAVAELRPHPGHLVSTAQFVNDRPILIADFARYDIRLFLSDDRLELLRRILSFSALLNLPVQPERKDFYALTQTLCDAFRNSGFEGVAFRSSLAKGVNVACFVPDSFSIVEGSERVVEVESLNYRFLHKRTVARDADPVDFEVDTDPLSTLYDGLSRAV